MKRLINLGGLLCVLMAAPPAELFAQYDPFATNTNGLSADPRVRRANREKSIGIIGPNLRDFVETQGDEAVAAIFRVSRPVAIRLAEFHMSGEMQKLPRPRDLLLVIAQPRHGDDVAMWAVYHWRDLVDNDAFDAYLMSPMEYALGLKQIEVGAAEARARRLNEAVTATSKLSSDDRLAIVVGGGFLLVVGVLLWRRKRSSIR